MKLINPIARSPGKPFSATLRNAAAIPSVQGLRGNGR